MKKIISLLLSLILTALLFSCGNGAPRIEREDWVLASVTYYREVVYVSEELHAQAPTASVLDCTLKAKGGTLTVTDLTNDKTYTGSYEKRQEPSPSSADHDLTFGKTPGRALLTNNTLSDGTKQTALTISVDAYTLFFIAR